MLSNIYICLHSSVVRKLVLPKFKRTIKDYFTLYRSDIVQKLVLSKFKRTVNDYLHCTDQGKRWQNLWLQMPYDTQWTAQERCKSVSGGSP